MIVDITTIFAFFADLINNGTWLGLGVLAGVAANLLLSKFAIAIIAVVLVLLLAGAIGYGSLFPQVTIFGFTI